MESFFVLLAFVQPDLTVEEIAAVFRQNTMQAQTLRVEWLVSRKYTDEARDHHSGALKELQQMLAGASTDNDRIRINSMIEQAKAGIRTSTKENDLYTQMDYWTDRQNFQARCPRYRSRGGPFTLGDVDLISFPTGEAVGDRLKTHFGDIYITSCGEETDQMFRIWEGMEIFRGIQAAFMTSHESRDVYGFYPPLSLPEKQWLGVPHMIDVFYQMMAAGDSQVLGKVEVDGTETVLVQAILNGRAVRGFVDLDRGALPLRVETFVCSDDAKFHELFDSHVGICEDHPKLGPSRICRNISISEHSGESGESFFYPMSGLSQRLNLATSPQRAISTTLDFLSVHEEVVWEVRDLEINRSMSAENFALEFPEGTLFANSDTRETYIAGDVDGTARRFIVGAIDYGKKPRFASHWWLALAALLAIAGGLWEFRRRRRAV